MPNKNADDDDCVQNDDDRPSFSTLYLFPSFTDLKSSLIGNDLNLTVAPPIAILYSHQTPASTSATLAPSTWRSRYAAAGARHARALSDPPMRQSPAWLQPKNQHEHEPNPFEHSFSGKDYATMFHPPRRARSQSPKSSHGGGGGMSGDINVPSSSGKGFTPGSADLGNFGWALQQTDSLRGSSGVGGAARGGPLTPRTAMLNGIAMTPGMRSSMAGGNTSAHHGSTSENMMFDPTSIRTGFTPGGIHSGLHNAGSNNYPPHSPATQALFAMMTNATPGLPALPRVESEYSGSDSADNRSNTNNKQHPLQQAAHIQPSGNSSGSGRSPESGNSGHVHAQAIPRPINVGSIYGNRPNPMAVQQASSNASSSYSGYQGSQNLLSQAAPRPMPPTAFHNNNNNLPGSQNPVPQMRGPPNSNPPPAGQNPLFLLSQQMQPDMPEDDTVLAAAALSGLSTPRGTYVGGPGMPTIAPGTLSNNAGKMNLQQPPSGLNPASRPAPLTKANSAAQPSIAPTASSKTVPKAGKKGAAAGGAGPANNKRKKTDDSAAVGGKKPKRNTRRAAAANAQPIVDADTPSEDEDDDGMSVGGSIGRSDNGRNMSYNYGNSNAGQSGSQMDMSMPGQVNRTNSGDSEDKGDGPRKGGRGPKQQFETEEEKRKNFLERNRQGKSLLITR